MSYLYEIKEISKIYGHGGGATQALKSVNLTIEEGKLTAILGPSGSGKSTLLNILGALDKPTSGQVLFLGEDISHYSNKRLAKFRRENIGFVFQSYNLLPSSTIFHRDNARSIFERSYHSRPLGAICRFIRICRTVQPRGSLDIPEKSVNGYEPGTPVPKGIGQHRGLSRTILTHR